MTDWRSELVARYPDIFRRRIGDREITAGCPSVSDGWRGIIEKAIERMAAAVRAHPRGSLTIVQIKEKLGGLRIYYDAGRLPAETIAKIEEAIDLAEARAACTCDVCGSEGRLFDDGGWLATRCEVHGRGTPVPFSGGENTIVKYDIDGMGRRRVVSRRRYDRANDRFVDVTQEN